MTQDCRCDNFSSSTETQPHMLDHFSTLLFLCVVCRCYINQVYLIHSCYGLSVKCHLLTPCLNTDSQLIMFQEAVELG